MCLNNQLWVSRLKNGQLIKGLKGLGPVTRNIAVEHYAGTESLIQQNICAGRFTEDNPSDTAALKHSTL